MGARVWFAVLHPKVRAAAVILVWDGRVLLLRNSYRVEPSLPGGMLKRREDAATGAARELREEVGLVVEPTELRLREVFLQRKWGARIQLHLFEHRCTSAPPIRIDRREIVAAEFLPRTDVGVELPDLGPVLERLSEPGVW